MTTTAFRGGLALVDDELQTRAADVIVEDGRILAVDDPGIERDADEVIDATGMAILPGFVDGHCHLELTVQAAEFHVPLHPPRVSSINGLLSLLAAVRAERPHGWIVGRGPFGLHRALVDGRLPHRLELDAISPSEPLVVLAGLHVACLNTAGMAALGLNDMSSLPTGIYVHTDDDGVTGVFTEVWDRLPTHTVGDTMTAMRAHAAPIFSRQGTTSVSTISTSAEDVRALHRLAQLEQLPMRVRFFVHVPRAASLDDVLRWGPESGFGNHMLRFGGVKIFIDGEGGDGLGGSHDDLKWSRDELIDFVDRADAAGVQLLMHAVTPKAVRLAAEAVLSARTQRPARFRHRIEHGADNLDLADLPLIRQACVGLVATPHFVASPDGDDPAFQPLQTLISRGHQVIGGTDATGTVPSAAGALANIAAAAGRVTRNGEPSTERISIRDGIRMFTTWSAAGVDEAHEKGVIAPGALADLVLLDRDPLRAAPDEVANIEVVHTVVGGRKVA